ncbi:MAG: hypothetical protein JXA14_00925 [Anaerolineae bacterium]|nr:hypothetical protein [Anaerolineae bacterium]
MLEPRVPNPYWVQVTDTMRRHELSEAIRGERLARQSDQLSPVCRFLVRVGDLLIAAGRGLRARYAPTVQPASEVCCAEC